MSERQRLSQRAESATVGRPTTKASAERGEQLQLKRSVRAAEGLEAQSALLAPVQMFGGWFGPFGFARGGQGDANQPGGPANANQPGGPANANQPGGPANANQPGGPANANQPGGPANANQPGGPATENQQGASDAGEAPAPAPVADLPRDFGAEGVLRVWISEFNKSLVKRADKGSGVNKRLDRLKQKEWADDNGLSYELLAAAAAKEPASTPSGQPAVPGQEAAGQGPAPAPVTNARILAMMAKGSALLNKVITPEYQGKCMQFSQQMLKSMGAKRADGSTDTEKRSARMGPLTAQYRHKHVKELPATLPAGYQICITSMPEWGFTEVGNHWFVSAGDGFYLDNTSGVFDGAGMTANLRGTTGDQWASRVLDLGQNDLRTRMGEKFVQANPQFAGYSAKGRSDLEKKEKLKGEANPDYKDASAEEVEGRAAIKQFVLGNKNYWPRIWLVEPTTKAAAEPAGP